MSDEQKLVAEIATRLMLACVEKGGIGKDLAYANRCLSHAKRIVEGAKEA
jgi:hypothetical protein